MPVHPSSPTNVPVGGYLSAVLQTSRRVGTSERSYKHPSVSVHPSSPTNILSVSVQPDSPTNILSVSVDPLSLSLGCCIRFLLRRWLGFHFGCRGRLGGGGLCHWGVGLGWRLDLHWFLNHLYIESNPNVQFQGQNWGPVSGFEPTQPWRIISGLNNYLAEIKVVYTVPRDYMTELMVNINNLD